MAQNELRHLALTGEPWPVIGVRVRREDHSPLAASWRPAPHAVLEDALLPCIWPELERLAEIATGRSRVSIHNTSGVSRVQGAPTRGRAAARFRCSRNSKKGIRWSGRPTATAA